MELNEAVRRIVVQHWKLVALCVLGGIIAAALVNIGRANSYTASARLVLDTPDPKSRAESMAIADTGTAFATSTSQVGAALTDAGITNRDPVDVAQNHVSVSALGTSAVLQLTVSDRDPRIAALIANALAARMINTRLTASNGRATKATSDLERRIAALSQQAVKAGVEARQVLLQQRGALESELGALTTTNASRPTPLVISRAQIPIHADPSTIPTDAALGGLLGLILGLGLAGLMEVLRPTIVGGTALAEELETIYLGALPQEPGRVTTGVTLATRAADVRNVGLIGVGQQVDLMAISGQLETMATESEAAADGSIPKPARRVAVVSGTYLEGSTDSAASRIAAMRQPNGGGSDRPLDVRRKPRPNSAQLQIRPYSLNNGSTRTKGTTGLILVTRKGVRKSSLDEVRQLLNMTGQPVLGLITITKPGRIGREDRSLAAEVRSGAAHDTAKVRVEAKT